MIGKESTYPLESFVFYRSFRDAIEEMTDENKLATLLAICDYALYGVEPNLKDVMSRAVFTVARPSIDANKNRRVNGSKGGRPPKKPMVIDSKNLWFSKSESTETETVSETGTEAGTEADKPPAPTRKKYGRYGWVKLTDSDYNRLLNDLGQAEVERCIAYVDESAQSNGNKNRWRDWNLVIRRCHRDGWGLSQSQQQPPPPRKTGNLHLNEDGEEVVTFE